MMADIQDAILEDVGDDLVELDFETALLAKLNELIAQVNDLEDSIAELQLKIDDLQLTQNDGYEKDEF